MCVSLTPIFHLRIQSAYCFVRVNNAGSAAEGVRCPVAGCDYSSLSQLVISAHLKVAHKDLPNELLLQMSLTSAAAPAFAAAHGDWKPPVPLLPAPPHTRIDSLP